MTIAELIAMVDEIRPNQITKQTKTAWLSEIEHRQFDEVMSRAEGFCPAFQFKPYDYDMDAEVQLMIPDVYADVYRDYLYSKVDAALGEIDRYNNDVYLFNDAWADYAAWYRRNNKPKGRWPHGEIAIPEPAKPATAQPMGVPGLESEPRCESWRVCGYGERIRPVFPCHCCTRAEGND